MESGEKGMNIINPREEYWLSQGLNQRPPVLKSCTLPTELWDLAQHLRLVKLKAFAEDKVM